MVEIMQTTSEGVYGYPHARGGFIGFVMHAGRNPDLKSDLVLRPTCSGDR